jgi:hypothetical protein
MGKKEKIAIVTTCLLAVLVLAGCGNGNTDKNGQKNIPGAGQGQNPPAEMSSACQGKNEGDSCEVSMPQRDNSGGSNKISGTCKKMGNSAQLVCLPANMPTRPNGDANGNGPAPM